MQDLNKDIITSLIPVLNTIHKENRTRQYWELLLGYWVNVFTAVMYDRWSVVKDAIDKGLLDESAGQSKPIGHQVANNSGLFINLTSEDAWNASTITWIVNKCFWHESAELVPCNTQSHHEKALSSNAVRVKTGLKDIFKRFLNTLSAQFGKKDQIILVSDYMQFRPRQKLLLRFGIGPRYWSPPKAPEFEYKHEMRSWEPSLPIGESCFTSLIIESLPKMIPKAFVEGYQWVAKTAESMGWPDSPKVIWTSNSHFTDEVFNAWAGAKRELGSRFIIGEHGGFGTGDFNGAGTFQLHVADRFISTGWESTGNKITPVGNFRQLGVKQKWNSQGGALLVCVAMPRYSFDMRSMVIAGQMVSYFEEQFLFVDSLPADIRERVAVRLYPHDYGWNQKERWRNKHPSVKLDDGSCPIKKQIQRSRVIITTYNATAYLETMFHNIPTIIYWNPDHWEVNNDAQPLFEELKRVGIFHDSPHSAAKQLSLIWDNIEEWWYSNEVQEAKNSFCDKYSANPPDMIDRLEKVLRVEMEVAQGNIIAADSKDDGIS